MILAFVRPDPAPEPPWFQDLGLESVGEGSRATIHLGIGRSASRFRDGRLAVIAERADAAAVADTYRRFGQGCVGRLSGRFRFIVHDVEANRLFAASSTAPPWPLTYWCDSHTTLVCSRLLPMLRCPEVPRALDESYLAHLVMGLSAMPTGSTAIRGVRRLGSGEALTVDSSGVWVARVDRLAPRHIRGRFGEIFVEELGGAVAASTVPGPSFVSFSGGLDSAAIVGSGLRKVDELAALSFVAPAVDGGAESDSIGAMERAWPGLHVTRVDASEAHDLPDLGSDLRDDPPLTPVALLPARWRLWSGAREAGFRTVLEGEGGDELFAMLPTPLDALRRGHLFEAARYVLASSGRRALVEDGLWLSSLPAILRRPLLARRGPIEAHLPAFSVWDASQHPTIREAITQYLDGLVHRPFAARMDEWLSAPMVVGAALSRRHLAEGFGLEIEWPMLDRGLLEVVLGLHAAHAIRGARDRPFLKGALAGIVPDDVRLLPKNTGFYKAFIARVLTSARSRQALRDTRVRARLADLVRFERIEAMLDGLAAGRSLGMAALWSLECVVGFAEWYGRASREYGVD